MRRSLPQTSPESDRLWSTHEVVEATGLISRTLRHYDRIGLLVPSHVGAGGLRYYDQTELLRLQRILLLRETGMPLAEIADVVNETAAAAASVQEERRTQIAALRAQRERLQQERERLETQMTTVETTIKALQKGIAMTPKTMFDGFNHEQYDAEVRQRWGDDAADRSNAWWNGLGEDGQRDFRRQLEELNTGWDEVVAAGESPVSDVAQGQARRHVEWLGRAMTQPLTRERVQGIVQMYVDDERFAQNYNRVSASGPQLVRDAVHHYAQLHLPEAD
ncbi:MerR family transcriptional regulator [Citricoccus sp. NR2]|uniref:MerR family transcriptional regulator n=1 Tax=Citricoccus sp. NR2 TaxID=3004095 RepID=UPI0022DCFAC0|nr:MerR family transcriptional regulator [Citricoccus sp. NR2]WBL19554.1 MerR family transcriptional regulator [Citricoccus sp. NR2]